MFQNVVLCLNPSTLYDFLVKSFISCNDIQDASVIAHFFRFFTQQSQGQK